MKRNPRRAYNCDGTMAQPVTVGSHLASGHHLAEIWCNTCTRHVEVPVDDLPHDLPIPDICLRYRCSRCGGKQLTSRGSVSEMYRVIEEQTGMSHGNRNR